jgi:chromosome segregation ATPase
MQIDDLPDEFEAFVDRARTVFGREMEKARKALDELNAQAATAQTTLSEVQTQIEFARNQLNNLHAYSTRASTLARLDQKIAVDREATEKLTAEKTALETSIAALEKQRTKLEAEVAGLADDARMYRAERADAYADIDKARAFANSWRTA